MRIAAVRRASLLDIGSVLLALIGVSIPIFWLGLMMQYLFAVNLGWLPISQRLDAEYSRGFSAFTGLYVLDGVLAGKPNLSLNALRHLLKRRGEKAGVHCNPHKWRHTAAVQYLRNGGRLEHLKALLGHTDFAPRNAFDWELHQFLAAKFGHVSWERRLDAWGVTRLALNPLTQTGLVAAVRESTDWTQVYEDEQAVVFERQSAEAIVGRQPSP